MIASFSQSEGFVKCNPDLMSFKNSDSSNCDVISDIESYNCDIVSHDKVYSTKRYVLMPFIYSRLASGVKTFFHNHNVKVSFRTGRKLYTLLRPCESYKPMLFTNTNAIPVKGITLAI